MQTISREEVQQKLQQEHTQLVEVLPEESFQEFHLPHAKNAPVGNGFDERIQQLVPEKSTPVIVYCKDQECQASVKAAQRMEELGYETVFDYEAGKVDWKEAGLPVEA